MGKNHILEDAPIYSQYIFRDLLHRVNVRCHTGSTQIEDFYRLIALISTKIRTPEGIYYYGRDREDHQYDKGLCNTPKIASDLCLDCLGLDPLGWIGITWGLSDNCRF